MGWTCAAVPARAWRLSGLCAKRGSRVWTSVRGCSPRRGALLQALAQARAASPRNGKGSTRVAPCRPATGGRNPLRRNGFVARPTPPCRRSDSAPRECSGGPPPTSPEPAPRPGHRVGHWRPAWSGAGREVGRGHPRERRTVNVRTTERLRGSVYPEPETSGGTSPVMGALERSALTVRHALPLQHAGLVMEPTLSEWDRSGSMARSSKCACMHCGGVRGGDSTTRALHTCINRVCM
jgi:hypothetical protein